MKQQDFHRYQHIERFGTAETEGIENGMCYVFPKIDGTNGQIWIEDGLICAGSRNRELSFGNDNQGFMAWACNDKMRSFLNANPDLRLYGEWLVPHTLRTYEKSAWNRFYVFDVVRPDGSYLSYNEYQPILEKFDIDYIPPICMVRNPTYDRLIAQLEKNTFLIQDGMGSREGIVIKRYDFVNKYGRVVWAKIVKNEFKAKHQKADVTELKEKKLVEQEIVDAYVTEAFVRKEYAKIAVDGWSSKFIPRLLSTVFYCLITEESWNFVKQFKNPTVNYKTLSYLTTEKIKQVMPEIF